MRGEHERREDEVIVSPQKTHTPDQLLSFFSIARLTVVLVLLSMGNTNFFGKNSEDNWPKEVRLAVSIEELIYFFLGLIALSFSFFNDPKRTNIFFYGILKTLDLVFSLIAASLIISDLPNKGARADIGFVCLCFSLFLSKLCDISYADTAYGGFTNFSNQDGNQAIQNTGNFNVSCCPYGFYYERNKDSEIQQAHEAPHQVPHERTTLLPERRSPMLRAKSGDRDL